MLSNLKQSSHIQTLVNEITTNKLTRKQKELLVRLSLLYSDLAKECLEDERFDEYLAEHSHLFPMSVDDLAVEWIYLADPVREKTIRKHNQLSKKSFSINDRVIEIKTGANGTIVDLDFTIDKPYGVLFDDEYKEVWWCDKTMIRLETTEEK